MRTVRHLGVHLDTRLSFGQHVTTVAGAARKAGLEWSRSEVTEEMVGRWQELWDSTSTKAAWTKRLITNLTRWWTYGPRDISFHMAQVLSGHGCFQSYLWKRGRAISEACCHCESEKDDVEHTVFNCTFWNADKLGLDRAVGRPVVPEDVSDLLCGPVREQLPEDPVRRRRLLETAKIHCDLFKEMVEAIMSKKEELERH